MAPAVAVPHPAAPQQIPLAGPARPLSLALPPRPRLVPRPRRRALGTFPVPLDGATPLPVPLAGTAAIPLDGAAPVPLAGAAPLAVDGAARGPLPLPHPSARPLGLHAGATQPVPFFARSAPARPRPGPPQPLRFLRQIPARRAAQPLPLLPPPQKTGAGLLPFPLPPTATQLHRVPRWRRRCPQSQEPQPLPLTPQNQSPLPAPPRPSGAPHPPQMGAHRRAAPGGTAATAKLSQGGGSGRPRC